MPAVRGPEISRPFDDLVDEVEALAADGVTEVTLLGQNVNSYGRDLTLRPVAAAAPRRRASAVRRAAPGRRRRRRASAVCATPARIPRTSGPRRSRPWPRRRRCASTSTCRCSRAAIASLAAMHRGYTAARYLERLAAARAAVRRPRRDHRHHRRLPRRDRRRLRAHPRGGGRGRVRQRVHVHLLAAARHGGGVDDRALRRTGGGAERFERLRVVVERSALARHTARVGRERRSRRRGTEQANPSRHHRSHPPEQARALRRAVAGPPRHLRHACESPAPRRTTSRASSSRCSAGRPPHPHPGGGALNVPLGTARHRRAHGVREVGARAGGGPRGARASSSCRSTRCRCTGAWTSARPSPRAAEQAEVPHHLIDLADPSEDFTVVRFREPADDALAGDRGAGPPAVLVGGTGLYLRAVIDRPRAARPVAEVRAELEAEPDTAALHAARRRSTRWRRRGWSRPTAVGSCGRSRSRSAAAGRSRRSGPASTTYPPTAVPLRSACGCRARRARATDRGPLRRPARRRLPRRGRRRSPSAETRCPAPPARRSATRSCSPTSRGDVRARRGRGPRHHPDPPVRRAPGALVPPRPADRLVDVDRQTNPLRADVLEPAGRLVTMHLTKHHGLGNDFLVAARRRRPDADDAAAAPRQALCDRHAGIGADGLLIGGPARAPTAATSSMALFNADGGRAEMSGNGIRCLAQAVLRDRGVDRRSRSRSSTTDAGVRRGRACRALAEPSAHGRGRSVDMGAVSAIDEPTGWHGSASIRCGRSRTSTSATRTPSLLVDDVERGRPRGSAGSSGPRRINLEVVAAGPEPGRRSRCGCTSAAPASPRPAAPAPCRSGVRPRVELGTRPPTGSHRAHGTAATVPASRRRRRPSRSPGRPTYIADIEVASSER